MLPPIVREWYLIFCLNIPQWTTGITYGFPAVLTPALVSNSSDIQATREEASWVVACYGMSGSISFLFMPAIMQMYGRRVVFVIMNTIMAVGCVTIAVAPDVTHLIAGRLCTGISFSSMYITGIALGEYCHPKRRGIATTLMVFAAFSGVLTCHTLGYFVHWRVICWVSLVPALFSAVSPLTWPESPAWYAYKGKYDDSRIAFETVRGKSVEAKKEIAELITAQKIVNSKASKSILFGGNFKSLLSAEFLKPLGIILLITIFIQSFGVYYLVAYLIEIMIEATGERSKGFFFAIAFDIMKVSAAVVSLAIVKTCKRRTILFTSSAVGAALLVVISVSNYLIEIGVFDSKWVVPSLLTAYSFFCNAGIIPLSFVLKGELFPLKYRGIASALAGIFNGVASSLVLKLTSNMLSSWKLHGTFAVYLCVIAVCLVILYFVLPETKDRTLQDIESEFIKVDMGPKGKASKDEELSSILEK